MNMEELNKEDIVYFLNLIDSVFSPNRSPNKGCPRPYKRLFKKKVVFKIEYIRFLKVYLSTRRKLKDTDRTVLDFSYGLKEGGEIYTDIDISKKIALTPWNVAKIRKMAEHEIGTWLRSEYDELVKRDTEKEYERMERKNQMNDSEKYFFYVEEERRKVMLIANELVSKDINVDTILQVFRLDEKDILDLKIIRDNESKRSAINIAKSLLEDDEINLTISQIEEKTGVNRKYFMENVLEKG